MSLRSAAYRLFVVVLLWPVGASAQATQGNSRQSHSIGAPQVLEIPLPQAEEASQDRSQAGSHDGAYQDEYVLPDQARDQVYEQGYGYDQDYGYRYDQNEAESTQQTEFLGESPGFDPSIGGGPRTYLGVLYATTEEGPEGVKVLSVVPDSPAARAGFEGANTPPEEQSGLLKAAIVVLAMSPAGPFAIPLAIAHDMYTNRNAPGDLIVAIDNKPTRNAQEFTETMRSYKPGDTAAFSVIRAGKQMSISVQLEEEPL